jgi:hypothetical protein
MSTGTKALLLEAGGEVIRELNRSYYCTEAYRYPLALFTLPDRRTGLVHCPEHYNRLEVEVARTGELLTGSQDRDPGDFFHSRLAVSPDGRSRTRRARWPARPAPQSGRLVHIETPAAPRPGERHRPSHLAPLPGRPRRGVRGRTGRESAVIVFSVRPLCRDGPVSRRR